MKINNSYGCFSEQGECNLPDIEEINSIIDRGLTPTIFADSCVCIHIIKLIDHKKNAKNVDFIKILMLKEYLTKHLIKLDPFFGILELSIRNTNLDEEKLKDFYYRIDFFSQLPIKSFRKLDFDFHRNYFLVKEIGSGLPNIYKALEPSLKNSFCALLKIRSLALKNLSKNSAENNIDIFLNWMIHELGIIRGPEYKLAMNIFGGNTNYRKMIGLDSSYDVAKKFMQATAWDIYHAKHTANSFRISQLLEKNIMPYFITNDSNLFDLMRRLSLTFIKDGGSEYSTSFIHMSDFYVPHFSPDFVARQNKKMIEIFTERTQHTYEFDLERVNQLIIKLETENNI